MIVPTVGRVLLFYPGPDFAGTPSGEGEPLPCSICRVWSDTCVNVGGFDANGVPFSATSVLLVQDEAPVPGSLYATWMPYQREAAVTAAVLAAGPAAQQCSGALGSYVPTDYDMASNALSMAANVAENFNEVVLRAAAYKAFLKSSVA